MGTANDRSRRGFLIEVGGAASSTSLLAQIVRREGGPNPAGATRTWRVGIIGRTGRGDYGHGLDRVWRLFPNVQIAAVADEDAEGLKKAAERLGVRAMYRDYRKMLRQERPDVVCVAPRWPDCHVDMVLAAAEASASIYLEKPMARSPAEADRMIAACDRAHVKLAVAHQMHIAPILELARQRLADGALGQLLELRGRGKEDARAGGEDLMVLGTHIFDLIRQFAGDPLWALGRVTSAGQEIRRQDVHDGTEGLGPVAGDAVAGQYAFRDGINGYFASKKSDETSGSRFGLDLYGSHGIMTIRAGMKPQVYVCPSVRWTDATWTRLTLPGDPEPPLLLPGNPQPRYTDEANRVLVADLLDAIEHDREPRSSGREARWTLEMVMALYESQLSGGRVHFPLKSRGNPLTA
jgi:predicted dehydrogenase